MLSKNLALHGTVKPNFEFFKTRLLLPLAARVPLFVPMHMLLVKAQCSFTVRVGMKRDYMRCSWTWLCGFDLAHVGTSIMLASKVCTTFVVLVGFDLVPSSLNMARDNSRSHTSTRTECLHGCAFDPNFYVQRAAHARTFSRSVLPMAPLLLPSNSACASAACPLSSWPFHRGRTRYGSSVHRRRWEVSLLLHHASQRFTTSWHVVHRVARLRRACFGGEDRSNRV